VFSRAILLFTGYTGLNLFSSYNQPSKYQQGYFDDQTMELPFQLKDTEWFETKDFAKFDSYAYLNIATQGYDKAKIDEPHPAANWVFFPLYPILLAAVDQTVGLVGSLDPAISGSILSNLLLFAALLYVYGLCIQHHLDERQARLGVILMLLYPTSIFYSLPYTESLFLLLSAASIYYANDKRYALAFLAAALSTVTRVPGFINLFFVAGTVILHERLSWRYLRYLLYGVLSLIPMGLYLLYMKILTGDFLAPFHEQTLWYRLTAIPFENFIYYFKNPYFIAPGGWDNGLIAFVMSCIVFIVYLLFLALNGGKMVREPRQLLFWVYGALLIVIPFSSQPWYLASVVRYMMVCIPFFIYFIKLTHARENIRFAVMLLFAALLIITTIGFFNEYYFMA
jgi:Gpi18-like mannosyltransferase